MNTNKYSKHRVQSQRGKREFWRQRNRLGALRDMIKMIEETPEEERASGWKDELALLETELAEARIEVGLLKGKRRDG